MLCYRDYTRDGRRVNTHSLVIKKVKLSNFGDRDGMCSSSDMRFCVFGISVLQFLCTHCAN